MTITGSSGARFAFYDDFVGKYGDERVVAQGQWLREHHSVALPNVVVVNEKGYLMERLMFPGEATPWEVVTTLRDHVWGEPVPTTCHHQLGVMQYALKRAHEWWPDIESYLYWMAARIEWRELSEVCTHGDPTWENTMRRADGQLVLIDPIPPRHEVPNLLAVDLGKVLQSCAGYEWYRHGWRRPEWNLRDVKWLEDFPKMERAAAPFFAVIHFVRLLPYMPDATTRGAMRELARELLRL